MRVAVTVEQCWHVVPGGIATSTIELLRALAERPDLDLVGVAARHAEPPADGLVPNVPIGTFRSSRRVLYGTWQWLRRPVVERATGPVDVVHDVGYVVPPSRAPLIATVHDLWFLAHADHYTWHSAVVLKRGFDLARREARLVMCPSRATIEACRAEGIEAERLRHVPWGVRFRPLSDESATDIVRSYGVERPYVLYSGTIERRKNVARLLDAFARLGRTDVDLVLAGPWGWGPGTWRAGLEAAIARLGERCHRVDPPAQHLDALCAKASAVVYPSLGEGFGFPILYAMAHGAPVLTSRRSATQEVAGDAALLVDPLDVDAIADAILRLLDDRGLAADLAERGRRHAASFTWERSAELAAAVYEEAIVDR